MTIEQASILIRSAVVLLPATGQPASWADLGCGSGLFTEALAGLLSEGSTLYGIDTNPQLKRQVAGNGTSIVPLPADFVKDDLPLSNLDGILMANSLHYVQDKPALLQRLRLYMQATAPFLIVEYDIDTPVPTWVPYPVSYASLTRLFAGQGHVHKLGERPSLYGRGNLYAALVTPF